MAGASEPSTEELIRQLVASQRASQEANAAAQAATAEALAASSAQIAALTEQMAASHAAGGTKGSHPVSRSTELHTLVAAARKAAVGVDITTYGSFFLPQHNSRLATGPGGRDHVFGILNYSTEFEGLPPDERSRLVFTLSAAVYTRAVAGQVAASRDFLERALTSWDPEADPPSDPRTILLDALQLIKPADVSLSFLAEGVEREAALRRGLAEGGVDPALLRSLLELHALPSFSNEVVDASVADFMAAISRATSTAIAKRQASAPDGYARRTAAAAVRGGDNGGRGRGGAAGGRGRGGRGGS